MEFGDVVELLNQMRFKKRMIEQIKRRILEIQSDYGAVSSILSGSEVRPTTPILRAEMLVDKLLKQQEMFDKFLTEYLALEDKLYESFNKLTDEERYIILESYMNGKPAWKIGREIGYSKETVKRRKYSALKKLSKS